MTWYDEQLDRVAALGNTYVLHNVIDYCHWGLQGAGFNIEFSHNYSIESLASFPILTLLLYAVTLA